jgi:hypothetical protein
MHPNMPPRRRKLQSETDNLQSVLKQCIFGDLLLLFLLAELYNVPSYSLEMTDFH